VKQVNEVLTNALVIDENEPLFIANPSVPQELPEPIIVSTTGSPAVDNPGLDA
jgi:hypothetical protein